MDMAGADRVPARTEDIIDVLRKVQGRCYINKRQGKLVWPTTPGDRFDYLLLSNEWESYQPKRWRK